MLGLPKATEVNRRVAKEKLYSNANLTPALREMIKYQVEAVVWRNKLATGTFNVSAGETVSELQIFEIELRQRELDKRVMQAVAKAIPYKILFLLTFSGEAQVWLEAAGTFYNTDWRPTTEIALKFEGLNLDAVYENLARQIAEGRLGASGDIAEAVEADKLRQRLERDIATLEKKVLREKQFNKQVALNSELKRLREELEGMEC